MVANKQFLHSGIPSERSRTFLLASMKNFLAGEWRKDHTQKRGGEPRWKKRIRELVAETVRDESEVQDEQSLRIPATGDLAKPTHG